MRTEHITIKDKRLFFAVAGALFLLSFLLRWNAYGQHSYALGWDSYFYLVQLKAWINEGEMHSPDASLVYPLLRFLYFIVEDYELAFQWTSAFLASGLTLAAFTLVALNRKKLAPALAAGTLLAFSPQLTFFAAQYPKNLLGLTLLLVFITALQQKKYLPALLFFILNIFGHRMTLALAILYTLVAFGSLFFLKARYLKFTLPAGIMLLVLSLTLPGLIHWSDLGRFSEVFTSQMHFSPLTFWQTFGTSQLTVLWKAEVLIAVALFTALFLLLAVRFSKYNQQILPVLLVLSLLIFPFLKWSVFGFSFRFLMAFLLLAPVFTFSVLPVRRWLYFGGTILWATAFIFIGKGYQANKLDPPYPVYEHLSQQIEEISKKQSIELIIGHKAMAEYVTFKTGTDVMPWVPEYEIEKDKLWRIVHGVEELEFSYFSGGNKGHFYSLGHDYLLVKEADWQHVYRQLKADDPEFAAHLDNWQNPMEVRPYFLHRGKNLSE